ncbi:MAG: hypothetical protein ACSHWQ_04235 [Spongiibacteraceae bacterium]
MTQDGVTPATKAVNSLVLPAEVDAHFAAAHSRVDRVSSAHFTSLSAVLARHWRNRRDIPADLAALPRSLWYLLRKLWRRPNSAAPRALTGKEREVAEIVAVQLIDLSSLEALLNVQRQTINTPLDSTIAAQRLQQAVAQWGSKQDNSRDTLLFLCLGLLGRGLSDKILFGSASLIGASLATSVYLSQQGFFSALWASMFGAPAWVAVLGAVLGFAAVFVATPVIAPFLEWASNRFWARRRLHRVLDQIHRELRAPVTDHLWRYGGYLQFVPDVVLLLRHIR